MSEKLKVAVVNGYGINLDASYRKHLDAVVRAHKKEGFDYIIVSGSDTNAEAPGVTEAQVMRGYLVDKGVAKNKVIIEEKALTTRENLLYAGQIIADKILRNAILVTRFSHTNIVIFCKKPWVLKTKLLAPSLIGGKSKFVNVKVVGTAPANGWMEWPKQAIAGTIVELISRFIPSLEDRRIRQKFPWKFAS